jgi:alkylation response protein AidB-like acyl-CoA dehydrogenase
MGIAISDQHRELEAVVTSFLADRGALAANRARLDDPNGSLPPYWDETAELGWLGLGVSEANGGSGFGLAETAVVAEAMGAALAPGPFTTTVIAAAVLEACAPPGVAGGLLGDLVRGEVRWAFGYGGRGLACGGSADAPTASGATGVLLAGGCAERALVIAGDDAVLIDLAGSGVDVTSPADLDPSRPSVTATLSDAPVTVLSGAARRARAIAWTLLAAEATGGARACCDAATAYAKERQQFGRVIGSFQAVKHHCANMLVSAEMATAATWDAARAGDGDDLDAFEFAASVASTLATDAFYDNAQLNTQVHGGIGFTWEHDAHLAVRRSTALTAIAVGADPHPVVIDAARAGVTRTADLDLPPEADAIREQVRADLAEIAALDGDARRDALVDSGYAVPHWPKPFGRGAGPVEQLVIEAELAAADISLPQYGITSWVILTLIQHGTDDQIERWVAPALHQQTVWCQMFSEPEAGSDAASVRTRGERVDGGWLLNGQKVWTSVAHLADRGLVTIRTDPDAPKHDGITAMVIDMHDPGVEVRPLRQVTGQSDFNEVFLTDVFVPDDDVVGPVNAGWKVARSTFGNERVGIGGGIGGSFAGFVDPVALMDAHPDRAAGVVADVAKHLSRNQTLRLLNLRRAQRAVAGTEAGPEGNVTKLVVAEQGQFLAPIALALVGPEAAFTEGDGAPAAYLALACRAMTIAGGTSEITRNQIAERILGLPRDPLLR